MTSEIAGTSWIKATIPVRNGSVAILSNAETICLGNVFFE